MNIKAKEEEEEYSFVLHNLASGRVGCLEEGKGKQHEDEKTALNDGNNSKGMVCA